MRIGFINEYYHKKMPLIIGGHFYIMVCVLRYSALPALPKTTSILCL